MIRKIAKCMISAVLVLSFAGCGAISAEEIEDLVSQVREDVVQQTTSADAPIQTEPTAPAQTEAADPAHIEFFDEAPNMPKPDASKGFTFLKCEDEIYQYLLPYDTDEAKWLFADYFYSLGEEGFPTNMPTEVPCFAVYQKDLPYYEKELIAVVMLTADAYGIVMAVSFNERVNTQAFP